eukprot:3484023-Prymnesium_polylepis.1
MFRENLEFAGRPNASIYRSASDQFRTRIRMAGAPRPRPYRSAIGHRDGSDVQRAVNATLTAGSPPSLTTYTGQQSRRSDLLREAVAIDKQTAAPTCTLCGEEKVNI